MYIEPVYLLASAALLVVALLATAVWFSRRLDGIHALVNSRLSEMINHVVATGRAEAVLAALKAHQEGKEEGRTEMRRERAEEP